VAKTPLPASSPWPPNEQKSCSGILKNAAFLKTAPAARPETNAGRPPEFGRYIFSKPICIAAFSCF
jgi:hypothetical protein